VKGNSAPDETYRGVMREVQSPEHGPSTLIVLRVGVGRSARTWVVLDSSLRCTAVLTDEQAHELSAHLSAAEGRQH